MIFLADFAIWPLLMLGLTFLSVSCKGGNKKKADTAATGNNSAVPGGAKPASKVGGPVVDPKKAEDPKAPAKPQAVNPATPAGVNVSSKKEAAALEKAKEDKKKSEKKVKEEEPNKSDKKDAKEKGEKDGKADKPSDDKKDEEKKEDDGKKDDKKEASKKDAKKDEKRETSAKKGDKKESDDKKEEKKEGDGKKESEEKEGDEKADSKAKDVEKKEEGSKTTPKKDEKKEGEEKEGDEAKSKARKKESEDDIKSKVSEAEANTKPGANELSASIEKLVFAATAGKGKFTIENKTGKKRSVKIKCSDNTTYKVNPVFAYIEAGKTLDVEVVRNEAPAKNDKLVVLSTEASDDGKSAQADFKKDTPYPSIMVPLTVKA